MENPYFELHRKFRQAGAKVLLSSGQACVAFGVAAFSKDGDWVIREEQPSCDAVLAVLAAEGAAYRLGAPLDPQWLALGLTSHFEYQSREGTRIRYRRKIRLCIDVQDVMTCHASYPAGPPRFFLPRRFYLQVTAP